MLLDDLQGRMFKSKKESGMFMVVRNLEVS